MILGRSVRLGRVHFGIWSWGGDLVSDVPQLDRNTLDLEFLTRLKSDIDC